MTATRDTCLACGGALAEVFYETEPTPVHSCLLLDDAQEAEAFARGVVRLAPCIECGMVTNVDFNPKWSAYSPNYEDQQSFSPTFESFAGQLAKDLVARHSLQGAAVVDIGCSKGDMLSLLCRAGASRATGIDPSATPGRVAFPDSARIEFLQENYADAHTGIPAALICCRHTLEHILDVRENLERMRRHAVNAGGAPVFIEVPSMKRVLEEAAFEDIYYEHCSYFTPGALARALRAAGFGVTRLWLDYDDQYLLAEAVPDASMDRRFEIEETVEEALEMVAAFLSRVGEITAGWRSYAAKAASDGKSIAIWGSGSKCISVFNAIGSHETIAAVVDVNPNRWGRFAPGVPIPIRPPEDLTELKPDVIWIMNPIYKAEIGARCRDMGLDAEFVSLGETPWI